MASPSPSPASAGTSTIRDTEANLPTGQEFDPLWRVEMSFTGILRNRNWQDVTTLVRRFAFTRGRADELQDFSTCSMTIILDNQNGAFTPEYSPLTTPGRPVRIICEHGQTRHILCTGYVDEWSIEYPAVGKDAIATATCSGVFTLLQSVRSDTFLDPQITTDRIIQMASEVGPVELDIAQNGTIAMPEFELYETEVGAVIKSAATTEFGQLYENKIGGVRFDGRGTRFQQTERKIIFGDDLEIETGYQDANWDYSQNRVFNRATVTADPDDPQTIINLESAATYGTKQFSLDIDAINGVNDDAFNTTYAESLAKFIVGRYSEPALRVNSIGLNPAGDDSVWDELLALDINDRVIINRRPPGYTSELTTTTTRETQFGLVNAMVGTGLDPSGSNLSMRTVTNGRTTSSAWSVTTTSGVTPQYEIVGDPGSEYFYAYLVYPSGAASGSDGQDRLLTMTHTFVPVSGNSWYTISAEIYGATATMSSSASPSYFYAQIGYLAYDADFIFVGASFSFGDNLVTVPYNVVSIPEQIIWENSLLLPGIAYIKPYVRLVFSDSTIPNNTTVEMRFGNFRLHGPRTASNFNGTTTLVNGSKSIAFAPTDPNYVAPVDLYGLMSPIEPSIGTRIERECFVEQIRYDVAPGNDNWKVGLGLSDAITGAYWTLGVSKLGIDTRLAI